MEEENELLRFIKNYNGDFYYDFPVVLELICKEDRKEEYDNFKIRYSGSSKIKENHQGEFILASEAPDEVEEILTEQTSIPKLDIDAQRITTPAEIGRQFDSLRIVIDWGPTVDEFLQITAISTGIPQLCRQSNRQVKD